MSRHLPHRLLATISGSTLVLLLILVAALSLRVYNLDWDRGAFLHPDELHVVNTISTRIVFDWPPDLDNLLDPESSRLNPRSIDPHSGRPGNFAYGALPLFVTDLAASGLTRLSGQDYHAFFGGIHKVGRFLSAVIDTATVIAAYLLGRRLRSEAAGLVAAALYATTPLMIQLSHFFTTDVWMTAFAAFALCAAIRAADTGAMRWFALSGALFGLAMASKSSVALLAIVIAAAALIDGGRRMRTGETRRSALVTIPGRLGVAALCAFLAFFLFEPYAVVRPLVYIDQLREQASIIGGDIDVPYTRQYVGTTPLLYQVEHFVRWGAGPVAGVLYLAGGITLAVLARRRDPAVLLLTVWLVLQGAVIIYPEAKFLRYLAPLLPALAAGAGLLAVAGVAWIVRRWGRLAASAVALAVTVGIALWTAAFMTVYAEEHPRIEASRWIYENVQPGSTLTAELWDLALPVAMMPGLTAQDRQLEILTMDLYRDRPPSEVAGDIFATLDQADYVVLASNRVSSAVPRAPWRYPVQIRYYELLKNGSLGFTLAGDFHTFPGIGALRIDNSDADESFINYDHPRVLIFEKTGFVDRPAFDALMAPALDQPWTPRRHADERTLMLDQPVGELPVVADGRWSERITGHSGAALIAWVVLLGLLQAVGFPIAARLFPRFPDLGWGFARLLTILIAGYAVWILASVEVIAFRAVWSWLAILALALVALRLVLRGGFASGLRPRSRAFLGAELTFWTVFALFLAYRFINPDAWHPIWGGEKPMEFAHLNAILRSAHFPPLDPWYAGGYINYYYYGMYLIAFLFKLTGIPSEIAFNLAQPTVIALIASAGYSTVAALSRGLGVHRPAIVGGVLGATLLTLIGNLDAAIRTVRGFPDQIQPSFFEWTWAGSRAVTGGITEFPYFTGLYADLHAHVVAWPITILIAALCYSLVQQSRAVAVAVSASPRRWPAVRRIAPVLATISLASGSLFATNAWDVPAFAALAGVSIFMATSELRWLSLRLAVTLAAVLGSALLAFILFQPFFAHYVTLFGSLDRTRGPTDVAEYLTHFGALLSIIALGVIYLHLQRGVILRLIAGIEPFLLVAIVFLNVVSVAITGSGGWLTIAVLIFSILVLAVAGANAVLADLLHDHGKLAAVVLAGGSIAAVALVVSERFTLGLAVAVTTAGATLWLVGATPAARFTGALIAAGAGITAGTEIVYLVDDLASLDDYYRMNTIFKFYNQAWTFFALAAAALLARMLAGSRPEPSGIPEEELASAARGRWARTGVIVSSILILASLLYPLLATRPRLELRFEGHPRPGTLNALDWMRYGTLPRPDGGGVITFDDDLAAIEWFNAEVNGTPVIAEASIGPYRGNGSRISIATGLPAVIGWDRHLRQQRFPDGIDERFLDIIQLYRTGDPAEKMRILRKYDVEYVIVGDVERYSYLGDQRYATDEGLQAFEAMVGANLEIAFQAGSTVVYRVLPPPGSPV